MAVDVCFLSVPPSLCLKIACLWAAGQVKAAGGSNKYENIFLSLLIKRTGLSQTYSVTVNIMLLNKDGLGSGGHRKYLRSQRGSRIVSSTGQLKQISGRVTENVSANREAMWDPAAQNAEPLPYDRGSKWLSCYSMVKKGKTSCWHIRPLKQCLSPAVKSLVHMHAAALENKALSVHFGLLSTCKILKTDFGKLLLG